MNNTERSATELDINLLRHAPWNPRPEITEDDVKDITASILTSGLIQRIVVMVDPEDARQYIVIAGNRRLVACRAAGLKTVPVDIIDCPVEEAKRKTLIENLQRKDVDPIMEADLIAGLIADGMTQAEIAAETGHGEKWVARRANLLKLSKSWRERVRKGEKFTTDCLEHIAAYPEEIQEKLKSLDEGCGDEYPTTWGDISYRFDQESRDLKGARFSTKQCLSCTNNTGCHPDLFDLDGKKNTQLGRCLCEKCWQEKLAAHVADTIAKAEKKGVQIVRSAPWTHSVWDYDFRRSKQYNTLFVFKEKDGGMEYRWGIPPIEKTDSVSAGTDDGSDKLEEKRKKRERNKAIRKLAALCATNNNLADWLEAFFYDKETHGVARHVPFIVIHLFHGIDSYDLPGSDTCMNDAAAAFCLGKFEIPKHWTRLVAPQIIRELDPSRCEGFRAVPNAQLICAMFPAEVTRAPDGLTDDEVALIKAKSEPLSETEIEWDSLESI